MLGETNNAQAKNATTRKSSMSQYLVEFAETRTTERKEKAAQAAAQATKVQAENSREREEDS